MVFYEGPDISDGSVAIGAVRVTDDSAPSGHWRLTGGRDPSVLYFGVTSSAVQVGEIVLHDIDRENRESLVAYRIFDPRLRGRGIGSRALALLQTYVQSRTDLRSLVIITSRDNPASKAIAVRNGFEDVGVPREDPADGVVLRWST